MLARIIFHGKRGELRHRYRQGQEDQLGALGLIVNAVVLWNTIYMDVALNQLRNEGFQVLDEDVARLTCPAGKPSLPFESRMWQSVVAICRQLRCGDKRGLSGY